MARRTGRCVATGAAKGRLRTGEHGLRLVEVVSVEKADFQRALVLRMEDFEDAVQAAAGLKAGVDHIVTRNERDFANGPVPPIRPEILLAIL